MKKRKYIADINVTPFVDVMLVLLVIFLVTAPVVMSQIPVSLPNATSGSGTDASRPVFVTLTENGTIYLQDKPLGSLSQLNKELAEIGVTPGQVIYIRGDKNVAYGSIVDAMEALNSTGFKVSLVTQNDIK